VNAVTLELVDVLTFSASDQTANLVSVLFGVFCFKLEFYDAWSGE
jgi:hypothetical protein